MKIGLFTDTYYPQINGVATSVMMLKNNLEKLGHQVYVFTTTDPNVSEIERNVYRVRSLPFKSSRRVGIFYDPRLARGIRRLGLDIVHTNTEFPLGIFGRTISRELNIPLLHTYHTIYEEYTHYIVKLGLLDTIAKSAARRLSQNFCNSADKVVAPTNKVKDLLLSYNVYRDIAVIPTGINLDKYSRNNYRKEELMGIRRSLGIDEHDKVILYIGRLSQEKNIDEIINAMEIYLKDKIDTKFVIVGNGPNADELKTLARKIEDKTIFAGERPWDEIGKYYQIGDVFVSASQSETQGLTYIEALASGLPVVAKADKCLEGVVVDGINGFTYNSTGQFLQYLDNILGNVQFRKDLSLNAEMSMEKFSDLNFALNIEKQYKYLIRNGRLFKKVS
jgi:1,2-diacylglycerol 3-alpha-glucosyltransferase